MLDSEFPDRVVLVLSIWSRVLLLGYGSGSKVLLVVASPDEQPLPLELENCPDECFTTVKFQEPKRGLIFQINRKHLLLILKLRVDSSRIEKISMILVSPATARSLSPA
jgi:hypothetical protein